MYVPRVEHKSVFANGLRFAYLEHGNGGLVLLLHGFPDTAHTWDRTAPELAAAGYRVVAPFMRGYYPTAIPADGAYDTDTLAKDVLGLIEALGAERAIVVGHDWGANAAYAAAARQPERVRLLVTLAVPHPRSIKPSPRLMWTARHFLALRRRDAAELVARDDFAYVDRLVRRWSPTWNVPRAETARAKAAFREPGCLAAACAYYRELSFRLPDLFKLPITVPAVSFAGVDDPFLQPRAYEKARHCFTASYEVVQMPGGHFVHREHPDQFVPELARVLRDHDRVP